MMQAIYVRLGDELDLFDLDKPVSVQRYERDLDDPSEKNLVWCSHAGAEQIIETTHSPHLDKDYDIVLFVCKCGAFKRVGENYWEDAPVDGVYQEDGAGYER